MQVFRKWDVQVTLVLNQQEAQWLHMLMQNPHFSPKPELEPPEDNEMRRKFWKQQGP
jgi:hypothetical protein